MNKHVHATLWVVSEFLNKFTCYNLFICTLVFHLTGVHTTCMADPDLEIRRGGGGEQSPKNFFQPFAPQYVLKIEGGAPLDPPLYIGSNIVDLNMINPTLPAQPPLVFPLIEEETSRLGSSL